MKLLLENTLIAFLLCIQSLIAKNRLCLRAGAYSISKLTVFKAPTYERATLTHPCNLVKRHVLIKIEKSVSLSNTAVAE
jgi:hypothetical protein